MPSAIAIKQIEGKPGKVYYPLEKITIPEPKPKDNEAVITLTAAALNHRDLFIRQHLYPGTTFGVPLLADGVGLVTSSGPGAKQWLNKRVILNPGTGWQDSPDGPEAPTGYAILGGTKSNPAGTLADHIVLDAGELEECPEHLSDEEAAALPLTGLTGWRALKVKCGDNATAGRNILVTGIGGGVALMVLLFAVAEGCNVYVTSGGQEKIDKAVKLGAKGGVSYKEKGWEKKLQGMLPKERKYLDAIVDGAGGDVVSKGARLLKAGGIISIYGMTISPKMDFLMSAVLRNIEVRGSTMGSRKEFSDMVQFVREKKLRPIVSRSVHGLDLKQIDTLFDDMKNASQFGKLVVTLGDKKGTAFGFDDGANALTASSQNCKVFPGDWNYPKVSAWSKFDALLGGALIKTTPIAAPCYKSSGAYSEGRCTDISARFTTADLHGYPTYSINASNVAQIQLGVKFARNSNLRLVIKNTGHHYIVKSSGAGALSIWTHNLEDIKESRSQGVKEFHNDDYSGPAFKAGAGVQGFEILEAARGKNVTVLAGICETVGWAGGYLAGGGHSPVASIYDMAADQVLPYVAITADGRFVTASSTTNADLFWALRGGGGLTFGVITSVIVKAHPRIKVTKSVFSFQAAPNNTVSFWKAVNAYFKSFPTFTNAGTYSYFWIWNYGTVLDFQMALFFAPNHTIESFNNLTEPFFDELKALNISMTPNTTFYEDFYSANKGSWGADTMGRTNIRQATRLLPKSIWETPEKYTSFYETIRSTVMSGATVGGYHMAPSNPFNVDNAVNEAWRSTQSFLITADLVPDDAAPAELKNASDHLAFDMMDSWRKVAPNSAGGRVYLKEADIQESDWQVDFYGAKHYPKLLGIEKKWDPKGVFYATTALGSESWELRNGEQGVQTQHGRLCRV